MFGWISAGCHRDRDSQWYGTSGYFHNSSRILFTDISCTLWQIYSNHQHVGFLDSNQNRHGHKLLIASSLIVLLSL